MKLVLNFKQNSWFSCGLINTKTKWPIRFEYCQLFCSPNKSFTFFMRWIQLCEQLFKINFLTLGKMRKDHVFEVIFGKENGSQRCWLVALIPDRRFTTFYKNEEKKKFLKSTLERYSVCVSMASPNWKQNSIVSVMFLSNTMTPLESHLVFWCLLVFAKELDLVVSLLTNSINNLTQQWLEKKQICVTKFSPEKNVRLNSTRTRH